VKDRWLGLTAGGLIAVGLAGLLAVFASPALAPPVVQRPRGVGAAASDTGFASNGERIYYTGAGHAGPIPRVDTAGGGFAGMMGSRAGMMGEVGCVVCHGSDGRGRVIDMMGPAVEVPDIRYIALASPKQEASGTVPGWTDAEIAAAIRTGVEPSGQRLEPPMPRWDMDDADMRDTIGYLKELSRP
jgi:mono/diheme cytochrome c family protein